MILVVKGAKTGSACKNVLSRIVSKKSFHCELMVIFNSVYVLPQQAV